MRAVLALIRRPELIVIEGTLRKVDDPKRVVELCAALLRLTGQQLHALQWVCVVVQCCAIAIVQYDACRGTGVLPLKAYYMIGTATLITAITSVWNQLIIKGFDVPVNLQNSIMYTFGE